MVKRVREVVKKAGKRRSIIVETECKRGLAVRRGAEKQG